MILFLKESAALSRTGADKHAFQLRVPAGAVLDLAGSPAEVPYCQTRPDDEASDSDADEAAKVTSVARPIPYLERDPLHCASKQQSPSHHKASDNVAGSDVDARDLPFAPRTGR